MFLESILALIICSVLRKSLQTKKNLPQWDKVLLTGIFCSVGLMVADIFIKGDSEIVRWLAHFIIFYLLYIVFKNQEFRYSRPFIYSLLPLIIISFVGHITEIISYSLYHHWESYFDDALTLGYVWSGAMWFITKRQRKALEKERVRNLEIEKENKLNEELKAVLEVQVAERTALLTLQKSELENTLKELKSTQALLIQSEKMASLGELTAGIAHEIQNPLNFVNNFSEVNAELIDEMKAEMDKGNLDEAKAIANDIKVNEEKINQHGKRADAIVKGMLQHSRSSSGQKEPTDINALADEYLRLAYHGLRAKDKTFNATMKTDFDESIGNINIIPQDIGRVILNLITNAFYAAPLPPPEKIGTGSGGFSDPDYIHSPTVWVSTKKINDKVLISVRDNGPGISNKILDKIFQPFFTTKPTGEGTGLGLSLSYDIVKAHGGELRVETKEGEGTTFTIQLPVV
jgi:signal transduction histidine kinase